MFSFLQQEEEGGGEQEAPGFEDEDEATAPLRITIYKKITTRLVSTPLEDLPQTSSPKSDRAWSCGKLHQSWGEICQSPMPRASSLEGFKLFRAQDSRLSGQRGVASAAVGFRV